MKDQRKLKIRELKIKIQEQQNNLMTLISIKSKEDNKESTEEFKTKMGKIRTELVSLQEEVKNLKRNKTGSKFFEFIPTPGANRAQRRERRKLKRI